MLQALKKLRKDNTGVTAIEFAFVAPVLFLFIFGILEFGLMLTTQSALEGAATAAAREYKAAVRENVSGVDIANSDEIHELVTKHGHGLIDPAHLRVTAVILAGGWGSASTPDNATENAGNAGTVSQIVQYRLFYDYGYYTPLISNLLSGDDGTLLLRASTVVQNEPALSS